MTTKIDETLCNKALELAGPTMKKSHLCTEAVAMGVRIQAAKRLAALGGVKPDITTVSRRKS